MSNSHLAEPFQAILGRWQAQVSNHPFLGRITPDPVGQILNTGYSRFESPSGIDGLAKVNGDRLDLLAVISTSPGKGLFRAFIALAKLRYTTICVWHDDNPLIGQALKRYGFTPEVEINGDGEIVPGWRWDKPMPEAKPCTHSFFQREDGSFKCCHCKVDMEEAR